MKALAPAVGVGAALAFAGAAEAYVPPALPAPTISSTSSGLPTSMKGVYDPQMRGYRSAYPGEGPAPDYVLRVVDEVIRDYWLPRGVGSECAAGGVLVLLADDLYNPEDKVYATGRATACHGRDGWKGVLWLDRQDVPGAGASRFDWVEFGKLVMHESGHNGGLEHGERPFPVMTTGPINDKWSRRLFPAHSREDLMFRVHIGTAAYAWKKVTWPTRPQCKALKYRRAHKHACKWAKVIEYGERES